MGYGRRCNLHRHECQTGHLTAQTKPAIILNMDNKNIGIHHLEALGAKFGKRGKSAKAVEKDIQYFILNGRTRRDAMTKVESWYRAEIAHAAKVGISK